MKREQYEILAGLEKLGFTYDQACQLRRISLTLQRWFELECGTCRGPHGEVSVSVERDGNGEGKPFKRIQYQGPSGWVDRRFPVADRESGARKRLAAIMAPFRRRLVAYIQTDCRGASLYILRKSDVKGQNINSIYTRGLAVY